MKLNEKSKRLGIFIFYDRDSIVDDYVIYSLNSLKEAVDNILFISNSKLSEKELKKVKKYTGNINIRENVGLDAGAFSYAYKKYGKTYFDEYDEIILLNDTFYGPFVPYKDIINSMNNKDIDFWGLTANYESEDGTKKAIDGFIHSHIQTYFIAFRKSLIQSKFFMDYWNKYNTKGKNTFVDVVNKHESYFTYLLEQNGFKWDTYIDLSHYKSNKREYNYNIYGYSNYTLLKYFNSPFIKRKNFVNDRQSLLYLNDGTDTLKSIQYIKENYDYDINMINKNLHRLYSPSQLYKGIGLNYIVEENNKPYSEKNLIVAYIDDKKAYDLSKKYFESINKNEILLITEDEKLNKYDNKIKYVKDAYEYIYDKRDELINKYDYIAFMNLKGINNNFQEVSDSNLIRTLENTIHSDDYINGIMDIFKNNNLDILVIPEALNNKYIMNVTGRNYALIRKKIGKKIKVVINDNKIFRSYDGFWVKSKALKSLRKMSITFNEFVAIFPDFAIGDNNMIGKIYNKLYLLNDISTLETIFNSYLGSEKLILSYPNRMFHIGKNKGIFSIGIYSRELFRKYVPLETRKKLRKIIKGE